MKKFFLLLALTSGLLSVAPATHAWDKKDKALLIGAISTLVGGELIRQSYLHHKDLLAFARNRPHVLIAGLAIGAIAVRQYKDAVIDPIKAWVTGK